MTNPHDDLSSVADPGSMDLGTMTEPDNDLPGDLTYDQAHLVDQGSGSPGAAVDSPAGQGSPIGPPD